MNAMWVTKFFYLLLAGIAYLFFCLYLPQFSAYLLLSILLLPLGFFLAAHLCGRKLQAEISLSEAGNAFTGVLLLHGFAEKSYLAAHRYGYIFLVCGKHHAASGKSTGNADQHCSTGYHAAGDSSLFPATADKSGSHCISAASMTASTCFLPPQAAEYQCSFYRSARCACTARHRCRNAAW